MKKLTLAAILLSSSPLAAATGGPDPFGYLWADSDEPGIDTSLPPYSPSDLRLLGFTGDDTVVQVPLPATVFAAGFPLYGARYPTFWLSSNGWLSFTDPAGSPGPVSQRIPSPTQPQGLVAFLWGDWTLEAATAPRAEAGPTLAADGFRISLRLALKADPAITADLDVVLWNDGCVKIVYGAIDAPAFLAAAPEVGLESQAGNIGIACLSAGVPQNGARFRSGYAVVFCPQMSPVVGNSLRAVRGAAGRTSLTARSQAAATSYVLLRDASKEARGSTTIDAALQPQFEDAAPGSLHFYVIRALDSFGREHE